MPDQVEMLNDYVRVRVRHRTDINGTSVGNGMLRTPGGVIVPDPNARIGQQRDAAQRPWVMAAEVMDVGPGRLIRGTSQRVPPLPFEVGDSVWVATVALSYEDGDEIMVSDYDVLGGFSRATVTPNYGRLAVRPFRADRSRSVGGIILASTKQAAKNSGLCVGEVVESTRSFRESTQPVSGSSPATVELCDAGNRLRVGDKVVYHAKGTYAVMHDGKELHFPNYRDVQAVIHGEMENVRV